MKSLLLLVFAFVISFKSFSQITFWTDDFKTEVTNTEKMQFTDLNGFGMKFPINEDLKKYDRIEVGFFIKSENDEEFRRTRNLVLEPKSPYFEDHYGGMTEFKSVLMASKDSSIKIGPIGSFSYKSKARGDTFYFRISASFLTGYEEVWSEHKGAFIKEPVYRFSKFWAESAPFSFNYDNIGPSDYEVYWAEFERSREYRKWITDYYTRQTYIPFVGERTPNMPVYKAYEIIREAYFNSESYSTNRYKEFEQIEIKLTNVTSKDAKALTKLLDGVTDPEKIIRIILDYQS